jgi:hypothetical protein
MFEKHIVDQLFLKLNSIETKLDLALEFIQGIGQGLERTINLVGKEERYMSTMQDVLNDIAAETTLEQGLMTLVNNLQAQIKSITAAAGIPSDVQSDIDAAFTDLEANKTALAASLAANTPAAATA